MMNRYNENNGVTGYDGVRKRKDDYSAIDEMNQSITNYDNAPYTTDNVNSTYGMDDRDYYALLGNKVKNGGEYIRQSQRRWRDQPIDVTHQSIFDRQKELLLPKDSEERRRRSFVTAPNIVDDAIDDYYNNTFRRNLDTTRTQADDRAFEAYKRNVVPGANPFTALGAMRRETDPQRMLDDALAMDDGQLDAIAQRYAGYAGLDPDSYRRSVLEPAIRNRAIGELVDSRTPKSSVEYIGRQAWKNSLFGGLTDLTIQGYSGTNNHRFIDDAAMENYNPSRVERWGAGVGGLMLDSGLFAGIGAGASRVTGLATNYIKNRVVSQMLAKGASKGLTREAAEQTVKNTMVNSLATKILQSSSTQGLTLGAYDAAHSVVNDLLHGDDVNVASAVDAFGHGAATGTMLGVVGTPLKDMSRGLTGGKKIAASAGVLSAESAVFTASGEISKAAAGIEIEPIDLVYDFGESMATLLAMRMSHWRPSGREAKLNSVGRLKNELRFSQPEAEEIMREGVNPNDFVRKLENSLNVYQKNSQRSEEEVRQDYLHLMSSSQLSASTRAKLLFLVENKLSSTPPAVVDYMVTNRKDGGYNFATLDAEGRRIDSRICPDEESLKSALFVFTGSIRRNRIAEHERLLMQSYDSQNFFRQAGNYAKETGTGVEVISDAMYRKANGEQLSDAENRILDDILKRSNYNDNEVGQMLYDIRRSLEDKYNLKEGSLLAAVNKSSFHCSKNENEALNEYERRMDAEVRALYGGTSAQRAMELSAANRRFAGMGNEELKDAENDYYISNARRTGEGLNEGSIPTITEKYGIFSDDLHQPRDWNPEYVWNTRRLKHRPEDIERMAVEATELAKRLGCEIDVIKNENEISNRDAEYSNKVRSLGWFDELNNRIVINLPNNTNINEAKITVIHEIVGHKGLAELFGNYYYDFLEEVYNRGSEEVRSAIEYQAARKGGSYHAGADEYLALLSERTHPTPEQRNLLQRLRDFVRDMLRRFNIYNGRLSEADLVSLIQRHHSAILKKESPDRYRSSAFAPFNTAWRRDGGYYNDKVAYDRYNRYMQRNPNLDGIAPGFHNFKRHIYDNNNEAQEYADEHYRFIGEKGANEFAKKRDDAFLKELERAKKMEKIPRQRKDEIERVTNWLKRDTGEWYTFTPNPVDDIVIKDYLYRSLKLLDPKRASKYTYIRSKPKKERTPEEYQFIKESIMLASQFDDMALLKDIMRDDALYDMYPGIEDTPVSFHTLRDRLSLYDANNKVVVVDKRGFLDFNRLKHSLQSTVEHMIQERESVKFTPIRRGSVIYELGKIFAEARFRSAMSLSYHKSGVYNAYYDNFFKKYGLTVKDFNKRFPTFESFYKTYSTSDWPDEAGQSFYNVVTSNDELKKALFGPLDIIEEGVAKIVKRGESRNNGQDITLSETEDIVNKQREGRPPRSEAEILEEFERLYGKKY